MKLNIGIERIRKRPSRVKNKQNLKGNKIEASFKQSMD